MNTTTKATAITMIAVITAAAAIGTIGVVLISMAGKAQGHGATIIRGSCSVNEQSIGKGQEVISPNGHVAEHCNG